MAQTSTAHKKEFFQESLPARGWVFPLRLADQDTIRDSMVMFSQVDLPLAHRCRLMVEYAACLSGVNSEFGRAFDSVQEISEWFTNEKEHRRYSVLLAKRMTQGGDGVSVIAQLVQMRLADEPEWGVGEDFQETWLEGPARRLGSCEAQLEDPDTAWRKYRAHVEALDAVIPGRMDRFSTQFAVNYWSRCYWRSGENLLDHVQRLLVLLGTVRMGIATAPTVREARSSGREGLEKAFDTAARRVTWSTIRALEQHPSFETIVESMDPIGGLVETRSLCQI